MIKNTFILIVCIFFTFSCERNENIFDYSNYSVYAFRLTPSSSKHDSIEFDMIISNVKRDVTIRGLNVTHSMFNDATNFELYIDFPSDTSRNVFDEIKDEFELYAEETGIKIEWKLLDNKISIGQ